MSCLIDITIQRCNRKLSENKMRNDNYWIYGTIPYKLLRCLGLYVRLLTILINMLLIAIAIATFPYWIPTMLRRIGM